MQTIQGVLRFWKRQLQRDRVLLLGHRGCLSSERALSNIELDAQGAGGLGARVNMAFEGGKQVNGCNKSSCLGGHGPLAHGWSLVDLLNGGLLRPPDTWLLLVIGIGGRAAPPVMMLASAPAGQLES
jgi:hypothetical protein